MNLEFENEKGGAREKGGVERRLRAAMRRRGLAIRTEASYVGWYQRFVRYHGMRHPGEMGGLEVEDFLTHLAMDCGVAPSTQSQAFNALVFLYREVLEVPLEGVNAVRAKKPKLLPTVLSQSEVKDLFEQLPQGVARSFVGLLYGCGLRVTEGLRLRVTRQLPTRQLPRQLPQRNSQENPFN